MKIAPAGSVHTRTIRARTPAQPARTSEILSSLRLHAKDLKNLPPALLITCGEDDPMRVGVDEYGRRLIKDGVQAKISLYPNALYGLLLFAGELDAGKKCIDEAACSLRNAFNGGARALP